MPLSAIVAQLPEINMLKGSTQQLSEIHRISSGRKKSWGSIIGDSGNTRDGGKTVDGAIEAFSGGIGYSLLVALYACITFIYGSSWKGEMASEAKRYLDKSFEGLREAFLGEAEE
ncbi:hypothetical protein Tco_0189350 [Tanacetum coccineum]